MAPSFATHGMVACPHALASAAGVEALRSGGSAVDAAVAAASSLAVLYPHMCSIGGDAFWLIYDAKARKVSYLDGGGRAAAAAKLERFAGQAEIPFRGLAPATLTTPGAVASFCEAHARHGRLPFARCLESAIRYAADGFPVSARVSRWIEQTAPEMDAATAAIFLRGGPVLKNPRLADTLRAIAAQGRAGFYEGEVARELAKLGGFFTERDLAAQGAYWGEPIQGSYRGVTIYETPAPTQGFTVLEMLNLLEPLELSKREFLGPDHVHLLVQAKQIAYNDRDRWLADPRFVEVPIEKLLSKILCGPAPTADRPGARAALGQGALGGQPHRRHGLRRGGRRCRQCRVADLQPVRRLRRLRDFGRDRRGAAEPRRVLLARPGAPQSSRAGQGAAAYAHRLARLQE